MDRAGRIRRALCAAIVLAACSVCAMPAAAQYERAPIRTPDLNVRYFVWSYKELKERQIVMQQYDYSCGAAVLATIFKYYWDADVDEAYFLDMLPRLRLSEAELRDRVENGLTLTDLRNMVQLAGYHATMAKVTFQQLAEAKVPVVVGVTVRKHEHFVVVRGVDEEHVYVADPIRGNTKVRHSVFNEQWQKNAILAIAKPNTPIKPVNPLGIYPSEFYRDAVNRQKVRQDNMRPLIPAWAPIGP